MERFACRSRLVPASRPIARGIVLVVALLAAGAASSPAAAATASFASGTLIIPMDRTYQDYGMFKAYGLVYRLLQKGVSVSWSINPAKAYNGTDFTATTVDQRTSTVVGAYGYTGGSFIIDSANAAAAQVVITAWWAANGNQPNVHRATASFSTNVDMVLRNAPRIAAEAVNGTIAINYFNAAGIPDDNGNVWTTSSPNILAGSGTASNPIANGALFQGSDCSVKKYDVFVTPHNTGYPYSLTDPANWGTRTYAALDNFVYQGGAG